jgi:hypothetical protein
MQDNRRSPYQDYLPDSHGHSMGEAAQPKPAIHGRRVVINVDGDGTWIAVLDIDGVLQGRFEGTREAAVAWASAHVTHCLIYSPESRDLVPLSLRSDL